MQKRATISKKKLRIPGFDYSQPGAYFITVCVAQRQCLLGEIVDFRLQKSSVGEIVSQCWETLPQTYAFIKLDAWTLMPNHFHGIIWLGSDNSTKKSLTQIIPGFKSACTSKIKKTFGYERRIWQPDFYEHVIRNETELFRIREYIVNNPINWANDEENPNCTQKIGVEYDKYLDAHSSSWLIPIE